MKVYLNYLEDNRFDEEYIETPSWIKDAKSSIEFVQDRLKSFGINGIIRYSDGEYRLLPMYPNDSKFIRKPSLPIYNLEIELGIEKYDLVSNKNSEYLVSKWNITKIDDAKFNHTDYANSIELDELFDKIRWRMYDLDVNEYNSFINVNVTINSSEETKTFSSDIAYPEDPDELAKLEIGSISDRIKEICRSNFNVININIDVTNLKFTVNYLPATKTNTIIKL